MEADFETKQQRKVSFQKVEIEDATQAKAVARRMNHTKNFVVKGTNGILYLVKPMASRKLQEADAEYNLVAALKVLNVPAIHTIDGFFIAPSHGGRNAAMISCTYQEFFKNSRDLDILHKMSAEDPFLREMKPNHLTSMLLGLTNLFAQTEPTRLFGEAPQANLSHNDCKLDQYLVKKTQTDPPDYSCSLGDFANAALAVKLPNSDHPVLLGNEQSAVLSYHPLIKLNVAFSQIAEKLGFLGLAQTFRALDTLDARKNIQPLEQALK